jgi:hypothetical protein
MRLSSRELSCSIRIESTAWQRTISKKKCSAAASGRRILPSNSTSIGRNSIRSRRRTPRPPPVKTNSFSARGFPARGVPLSGTCRHGLRKSRRPVRSENLRNNCAGFSNVGPIVPCRTLCERNRRHGLPLASGFSRSRICANRRLQNASFCIPTSGPSELGVTSI